MACPMRLRLSIHRNELPAVNTLWPISNPELKHTISQLLEQVNATFPLESGAWGLEHYVVTVGGFECLHYHYVGEVCRDEDELVIRPLQYAEVRTRTVLGRDQIVSDGRHLYDGLPFGRPKLKGVVRPEVRIPPMKKVKLDLKGTAAGIPPVDGKALMRVEELDVEDSEEEDDMDYELEGGKSELSSEALSSEVDETSSDDEEEEEEEEDDNDEDDDSQSDNSSISNSSSSRDDGIDESSSDTSWNGCYSENPMPQSMKSAHVTEPNARMDAATTNLSGVSNGALKRKASMGDGEGSADQQPNKHPKMLVPPGKGRPVTKQRNSRRRESKRLAHLKRSGVLPSNANLETLREWKKSIECQSNLLDESLNVEDADSGLIPKQMGRPERLTSLVEQETSTETFGRSPPETEPESDLIEVGRDIAKNEQKTAEREQSHAACDLKAKSRASRLEKQRQHLLEQINSGGIDVTANKHGMRDDSDLTSESEVEAPDELSSKPPKFPNNAGLLGPSDGKTVVDMFPSVTPRSKLDSAGSNRMIFNSLGLRVPKTPAEKIALQKKLSDQPLQRQVSAAKKSLSQENIPLSNDSSEPINDDHTSWRDKLYLTAVECCDENTMLSQPPFPFHQRWDPQQRRKKKNASISTKYAAPRKKLLKRYSGDVVEGGDYLEENYDKYNTNGSGDALEYDEVDDAEDDEYWEDGALLDNEYDNDLANSRSTDADVKEVREEEEDDDDDGFPPLPNDISLLQGLAEEDAKTDDFITYQELTCSAATDWNPMMRTRTALLQGRDNEGWTIKLALRDVPAKEYDEEGRRVYSKFEMEGLSDDEEEGGERIKTVKWTELHEPRLLKRVNGVL